MNYFEDVPIFVAGNFLSSPKLFIRILAGIWCLMTVVVAYSFSGSLTSFLTTPVYEPVVDTFDDLAQSKTLKLTVEANGLLGQSFMVNYCASSYYL